MPEWSMFGDLHIVTCDTCDSRWPCHYGAWVGSNNIGRPPENVTSGCNVKGCDGVVRWTDEEVKQ